MWMVCVLFYFRMRMYLYMVYLHDRTSQKAPDSM